MFYTTIYKFISKSQSRKKNMHKACSSRRENLVFEQADRFLRCDWSAAFVDQLLKKVDRSRARDISILYQVPHLYAVCLHSRELTENYKKRIHFSCLDI